MEYPYAVQEPAWNSFPDNYHPPNYAYYDHPSSSQAPPPPPQPTRKRPAPTRRINVNQKERRRNLAINDAFLDLQRLIPHVPVEHSLPKIKTLRLAVNYIAELQALLCQGQGNLLQMKTEFARIVASEIQAKNSYKDRADQLLQQSQEEPRPKYRRIKSEERSCSAQ